MSQFDHRWLLPSKIADSPMAWMITFNGFIVDVRRLSKEIQLMAWKKGLIPYVPND